MTAAPRSILKVLSAAITKAGTPMPVDNRGGWFGAIRESFAGAWQRGVEVKRDNVLAYNAVFACQTLIASDIAKLAPKLVAMDGDGVWSEVKDPAYSPVLRKPNHFQTRIQFFESWVLSKLSAGNAYVLLGRDRLGAVNALYVLDPSRVTPLVADDGSVFYQLARDPLSGVTDDMVLVPAREIIHDRFNCLFHPLVGLSPIYACGLAATQGLSIQTNSARFFANGSRPGGILTAPGRISPETAAELKESWTANYSGENAGKVAVLGDGLSYEALGVTAVDAQLVEQLKWTAEVVCSTYHMPPYKIGVGALPSHNNIQALNVEYYSQCLQVLIESIEVCLDEGLGTGDVLGVEFDIENLLRMDSVTQIQTLKEAVGGALMMPNEARAKLSLRPVTGGDAVYSQQQNYSLAALAERDADKPFVRTAPAAPVVGAMANDNAARAALAEIRKGLS